MKAASKHTPKLLLLGVLVALVSMAVSMDVFGLHMSNREQGSHPLTQRHEGENAGFSEVRWQVPTVSSGRSF